MSLIRGLISRSLLGVAVAFGIAGTALAQSEVVIGVTYDAAKQASFYSLQQKQALELLESDVNAAGGVLGMKMALRFLDDENDPTIAAERVEKLNSEGAVFIIEIGSSATGLAAQQKAQELGIPNGSPGNQLAKLTRPNLPSNYFRTGLLTSTMGDALAAYIKTNIPDPKVGIATDTTAIGTYLADDAAKAFQDAGLPIVAREQSTSGAASVMPLALRIKSSGANVVVGVAGELPQQVNYMKAHRQLGNKAPIMGFSSTGVPNLLKLAGPAANGVIFTDFLDTERPDVLDLNKRLVAKDAALDFSAVAVSAYEFGRLVVDSIKAAGSTDRAKIRDAIEKTSKWPTLIGPIGSTFSFSPTNHDGITPGLVVMRMVQDGKIVTLHSK